ncbi:MAG: hypothetical protein ACRD5R_15645, partial [Candidatus Acidiferrales bacterium]
AQAVLEFNKAGKPNTAATNIVQRIRFIPFLLSTCSHDRGFSRRAQSSYGGSGAPGCRLEYNRTLSGI